MVAAAAEDRAAVVVLAFGTRGDVQPLAVLADGLRRRGLGPAGDKPPVVFVSHADHAQFLRALWGSGADDGIAFIPSPSPPHAAAALKADTSSPQAVEATLRPQAHLQACIDAACHGRRPRVLIANLFALEAVHLAEAVDAPLVMAHPYPAPAPAPAAFARRFRWMDPLGYKALRQAEPGFLAWEDVEHWLWPAMIDAWQPFRRMLSLASEESTNEHHHHHLISRPAPPLLYLYSETVLPRPDFFPRHAHVCCYLWPAQDEGDEAEGPPLYVPPAALASFLADDQPASASQPSIPRVPPVLVTFGTMVSLGALGPSLDTAAGVLAAAFGFDTTAEGEGPTLRQQGVRVLLDAAGEPAWAEALRRAFVAGGGKGVLVLEEPVPHSWLLGKCSVVMHHGGSGTAAAALRAGVAQVLIPMMMDQFLWAERVAWLDLGPAPLSLDAIFPSADEELLAAPAPTGPSDTLAQALRQALQPATRLRAAAFGRRLRAEPSGLDRCLESIRRHVEEEWPRLRASAPVPPTLPPLPEGCELLTLAAPDDGVLEGGDREEEEEGEDCSLTLATLAGSEAEVAFCCQEIFAPRGHSARDGWGYLKHAVRVREGDVVVDVGANIGLFGLYLDQVVMEEPDQLTVVAVEPAPRTFAALEYNLRRHGVKHQAFQVAVGEAPGRATLHFYPHMPGNSTLDAARAASPRADLNARLREHLEAGKETVEVEVTTLPLLLQRCGLTRVDLLKVDVEGHEEAVLRGMDEAAWSCVGQLVAEVHDREGARGRIDALLRDAGGFVNVVWERPQWAEEEGMDNVMVYATRE